MSSQQFCDNDLIRKEDVIVIESNYSGTDAQKDIPEPKLSKLMGPTIKFLYCYS